jgi:phosphate transport system protein
MVGLGRVFRLTIVPVQTHPHLEENLQRDITALRDKAAGMAGLCEKAVRDALQSLAEGNRKLAYSVVLRDEYIDEAETGLNRMCLEFLARHQPAAGHLRLVFTVIRITKDLERIGDYAESVARQTLVLVGGQRVEVPPKTIELGNLAVHMLHDAAQAFLQADADLAARTLKIEERANDLRSEIIAEVEAMGASGALSRSALGALLTVARRLERVADQAKNVCEEVHYMCTGEFPKHRGPGIFRVLFVDRAHSAWAHLAEAMGKAMRQPRFEFVSAGLAPEPISPATMEFIRQKSLPDAGLAPRMLDQVPDWNSSQMIVFLEPGLEDSLPERKCKAIQLLWSAPPRTDTPAAFEAAFEFLNTNLKELMSVVLEKPQSEIHL